MSSERVHGDRGSAAVEMAVLAPAVMLLVMLLALGFEVSHADTRISGVAGAAAREASMARSPALAETAAQARADQELASRDISCADQRVRVFTEEFAKPPGVPAVVRVEVSCRVPLSRFGIPGLSSSGVLSDSAVSPVDPLRSAP